MREAVDKLYAALETHPGILIEDKGCSVAIHWRMAPHQADFARETAQTMVEALGPDCGSNPARRWRKSARLLGQRAGDRNLSSGGPYRGRTPSSSATT